MKQFRFIKNILPELFIIIAFIGMINLGLFKVEKVIKADAIGYYDYLPALFIHHDFVRLNDSCSKNYALYNRIQKEGVYVPYRGYLVDKYPAGTAVLQLPFFLLTYLITPLQGNSDDGYQKPFQNAVHSAAVFYLFLGIILLGKILAFYNIKRGISVFIELLVVFGTGITNYANFDAGFSHVYSFFAINAFLYFTLKYFKTKSVRSFIAASLFFGLILILRQINGLILFFIPFLAGSFTNLKQVVLYTLNKPKILFSGIASVLLVFSIQCVAWYAQTGSFLLYSYQGEGFHFLDPQILNILFSYKKGLFVYTPALIFSLAGLFWLFYKKKFYQTFTWLFFFLLITYLFSSWYSWDFAAGFGLRAYIDYYSAFFILIAIVINETKKSLRYAIISLTFLAIPLNLIQTYQYNSYILHWLNMDKEKYWEVFLRTGNRFKGLLWKNPFDMNQYLVLKKLSSGDISVQKSKAITTILETDSQNIPEFDKVSVIRISMTNNFISSDNSKVIVHITDSTSHKLIYWHDPYLIHFSQQGLNKEQKGVYNYEFTPMGDSNKIITISILSPTKNEILQDIQIEFLKKLNLK
ncbi:MAG: hypothetical protein JXR65_00375 [Bacteroidales bacterium]|nr:hypothetical protein [Bacteroidales bacterium]